MNKKHFEAIASIIKDNQVEIHSDFDRGYIAGVEGVAHEMADYFTSQNPNFDRARFLQACGISSNI